MKLITKFTHLWQRKLQPSDVYVKSFTSLLVVLVLAGFIWYGGPYFTWHHYAPLLQAEKRFYVILFLGLVWLLKVLLIDLDRPNPFQYRHPRITHTLEHLEKRFRGALQFLKKTAIARHEPSERIHLKNLPWFLLIGPSQAGKTSLLSQSQINFILQKRIDMTMAQAEEEQCDWWITRDLCLIDVPGHYLTGHDIIKSGKEKVNIPELAWRHFLNLIKFHFGNGGISGIILTMSLPEMLQKHDTKQYQQLMHVFLQRLNQLKSYFSHHFPCYLIITKCDLLPGFKEFFAESGNDEITQAWGIQIPDGCAFDKMDKILCQRFDTLIKKLNQQLLWRLHQERDPFARPLIKDFPLQIERIKDQTLDLIRQLIAQNIPLNLKGVFLTSAQQVEAVQEEKIVTEPVSTEAGLQIFKSPTEKSRAFFIKQIFSQALVIKSGEEQKQLPQKRWQTRFAIAFSTVVILACALMMGRDFKQGVNQAYAIQNVLTEYQLALQKNQDADVLDVVVCFFTLFLNGTGESVLLKLPR